MLDVARSQPCLSAKVLAELRPIVRFIDEARESLINRVSAYGKKAGLDRSQTDRVCVLLDDFGKLEYEEYRSLIGTLHASRKNPFLNLRTELECLAGSNGISPNLSAVTERLISIYDDNYQGEANPITASFGHNTVRGPFDKQFARSTVVLLRASYPFGSNLRNPSWDPSQPLGFSRSDTTTLKIDAATLKIEAAFWGRVSLTLKNVAMLPDASSKCLKIKDGQGVIVGPALEISQLFIYRDCEENLFNLPRHATLEVDSRHIPAGGLLIISRNDTVYVFERGPVDIGMPGGNYSATPVQTPSGIWSAGAAVKI